MLPEFPNLKELKLPKSLDSEKTNTFLMMYRAHCQRILDTVIRANFDEVQTFVLYFWQGVPPHLSSVLSSNAFVNLIGICDAILYKSVGNVLLPSALQTLPDR
ncbi:transcription factor RFX4-like protein [Dinothrombium tinctorium]|uniref:Transcription factor RFX4-like protein n=1 Tax=Dinothrombium tinctorium TaxID=1965070 RepID=A0A3S3Q714_9ACAR|nr:transcription factor RFX4-like protein [Dinothrombium tinctorium]